MRIVFMGSADFGIPALEKLLEKHRIVGVVSTPAKPSGRGLKLNDSPVTLFAREHGIEPVLTPDSLKQPQLSPILKELGADLFVVVAFPILPRSIFTIPPLGTVNIHASLLPKYRGPAPIQRAIEAGETETGVTIFRIDEGIDTGEVILQVKIGIESTETTPELYSRLSHLGANALMQAVEKLENRNYEIVEQDLSQASKAPKLSKEEARIDWSLTAQQIYRKVRAFKPFPGVYFIIDDKRVGVEWAEVVQENIGDTIAKVVRVTTDYIDIQCGSNILRILQVKPEGRRAMRVHDFLLGTRIQEGNILQ